jgi:hypothetical protein
VEGLEIRFKECRLRAQKNTSKRRGLDVQMDAVGVGLSKLSNDLTQT